MELYQVPITASASGAVYVFKEPVQYGNLMKFYLKAPNAEVDDFLGI